MPNLRDALQKPQAKIIDVRTDSEHQSLCLTCDHIFQPLQELNIDQLVKDHHLSPDTELYFLCHKGGRAAQAAAQFQAKGFKHCYVIDGGISACESTDTRAATQKTMLNTIPLDGQVRITIGVLLLLLSIAGLWINSAFFFGVPLIGLAMIFSGITGWCGIGLCLARAPWNQAR